MKGKDVYIDYLPEINRWVIVKSNNGEIVKSYNSEMDAYFDYAGLRNGELTYKEIQED